MKRLAIAMALSLTVVAQSKDAPHSDAHPDGRAAFDRLVAAHDTDITGVVKDNRLVCFADKNPDWLASDRFLVVVTSQPDDSSWVNGDGIDGKTIYGSDPALGQQFGVEEVYVWEHEDNTLWIGSGIGGMWRADGHYTMKGGRRQWVAGSIGPVFRYSIDGDKAKALGSEESVIQDPTSFAATKKYANKAKGTTDWSLSVRLSTGRYRETWETTTGTDSESAPRSESESLGRCYRAKTLVKAPAPTTGKK
jgi:hypothetical protein